MPIFESQCFYFLDVVIDDDNDDDDDDDDFIIQHYFMSQTLAKIYHISLKLLTAHVLLNLFNELKKRDKMRGMSSILSLFATSLIK